MAAQGLTEPRPTGRIDARHFRKVVERVQVIQLDSVNVFSRAHYLPFFSRLGPYDRSALDNWIWQSGEMFEYWGHVASVLPVSYHRFFRWRMAHGWGWSRAEQAVAYKPGYLDAVLEQVRERGPLRTSDLDDAGSKEQLAPPMWNWSHGKIALEVLFAEGKVAAASRPNFVRMYDLPERVIPEPELLAADVPREEAQSILLERSARALGVGTADDLADYYRIRMPQARPLIKQLAAEGRIVEVEVTGWNTAGYLHPEARLPRKVEGRALLSPFDNLIFYRDRVERLWDFYYRIEIYVAGAEADPRVLRASLPPRWRPCCPGRSQDRSQGRGLTGQGGVRRGWCGSASGGTELRAELDDVARLARPRRRRHLEKRRSRAVPVGRECRNDRSRLERRPSRHSAMGGVALDACFTRRAPCSGSRRGESS